MTVSRNAVPAYHHVKIRASRQRNQDAGGVSSAERQPPRIQSLSNRLTDLSGAVVYCFESSTGEDTGRRCAPQAAGLPVCCSRDFPQWQAGSVARQKRARLYSPMLARRCQGGDEAAIVSSEIWSQSSRLSPERTTAVRCREIAPGFR
jgi:hypothetical protein